MRVAALLLSAAMLLPGTASAQRAADFPSKPVRLIVPFPAGGTTDTTARVIANGLSSIWKQPVVVENRPGGAQVIGADAVAKSAPDGYTLLIAANSLMYEHVVNREVSFNGVRDLAPISNVVGSGLVFIVPPQLNVRNFAEFLAYVKANPGKANQAQVGPGIAELKDFWQQLGVDIVDVPYKGGQIALGAIMTNEVQLYAHTPGDVITQMKAGKLRPIAYTDRTRHPLLPDLPALPEASGLNQTYRFWFGLWGPAGLPADLVGRVQSTLAEAMRSPEARERLSGLGVQIYASTPEEMRQEIATVVKRVEDLAARGFKLR